MGDFVMDDVVRRIGLMGLVPVVVIEDEKDAIKTAKAMIDGGLPIMEITLRTAAGLPSIRAIKQAYPEILMGAGTVLSVDMAKAAVDAGAQFIVSPGFNDDVVGWCIDNGVAITPGCVTPTEIEHALGFGIDILKFFPANVYGGINGCKALYGPYRMVKFIPTGGVSLKNLDDFADKEYIHAIGGGWLCKTADIASGSFETITNVVRDSIDALLGFKLDHICLCRKNSCDCDAETNNIDRAMYYLKNLGYSIDTDAQVAQMDGCKIHLTKK
jgi:2-dehydro-3-deoxyphosphogluconate aldolase/(4S)-4-hydroxy-2-oxoglutarate aldolase